jgi:hypothetical protein
LAKEFSSRRFAKVSGFPLNFWVNADLTVLRLVSSGWLGTHVYFPYMTLPQPQRADEEGRTMLRRFIELAAPGGEAIGGRLGDDVWRKLGGIQNVPIGGEPFGIPTADAGRHLYVVFDPRDEKSMLLWHRLGLMRFYAKVHWTPVPDLKDRSSLEACVHLNRCVETATSPHELRKLFLLNMLGYLPRPLTPEPSDAEDTLLRKSVELAELLQVTTRSPLPFIVWQSLNGEVYWTGGNVGPRDLLAIVEASKRFPV